MISRISFNSVFVFLFLLCSFACEKDDDNIIETEDFCLVFFDGRFQEIVLDQDPEFLEGGQEGFNEAFYGVIKYPAIARENGTEGTCILEYEITEEGAVENIVILQDPGDGIGAESKRTLELATEGNSFNPGVLNTIPYRVKKRIPIKFKLQ